MACRVSRATRNSPRTCLCNSSTRDMRSARPSTKPRRLRPASSGARGGFCGLIVCAPPRQARRARRASRKRLGRSTARHVCYTPSPQLQQNPLRPNSGVCRHDTHAVQHCSPPIRCRSLVAGDGRVSGSPARAGGRRLPRPPHRTRCANCSRRRCSETCAAEGQCTRRRRSAPAGDMGRRVHVGGTHVGSVHTTTTQ